MRSVFPTGLGSRCRRRSGSRDGSATCPPARAPTATRVSTLKVWTATFGSAQRQTLHPFHEDGWGSKAIEYRLCTNGSYVRTPLALLKKGTRRRDSNPGIHIILLLYNYITTPNAIYWLEFYAKKLHPIPQKCRFISVGPCFRSLTL